VGGGAIMRLANKKKRLTRRVNEQKIKIATDFFPASDQRPKNFATLSPFSRALRTTRCNGVEAQTSRKEAGR